MTTEGQIRDHLAGHLDLIEPGLLLEKKEKYLKNDVGAAGFVDIFCRDEAGKLVIIEIKKTDAAAREAIQELYKYAALLRKNFLVRATEYRLIVLSVEWHELLTPFSEFASSTSYDVRGGKIELDETDLPRAIVWVDLLAPERERHFSRRHFIWEYADGERARAAAHAASIRLQEIGLRHFMLAVIKLAKVTEGVSHIVYFAQQEESAEFYWEIIRRRASAEDIEEFEFWLEGIREPSDRLGELADKAWDTSSDAASLFELMDPDGSQISHPEKAQYWLSEGVVESLELIRVGMLKEVPRSDQQLLEELQGSLGMSTVYLDTSATPSSKAEVDALLKAVDEVFFYNDAWRGAVRQIVDYAKHTGASEVRLSGFSTDDIIKSIAWLAIGDPRLVPHFVATVVLPTHEEIFLGVVEWSGSCGSWEEIVASVLDGDANSIMWLRHFGEVRSLNRDIMEAMGLSYGLMHKPATDQTPYWSRLQGISVVKRQGKRSHFIEMLSECEALVSAIVENEASFDMQFIMALEELRAREATE